MRIQLKQHTPGPQIQVDAATQAARSLRVLYHHWDELGQRDWSGNLEYEQCFIYREDQTRNPPRAQIGRTPTGARTFNYFAHMALFLRRPRLFPKRVIEFPTAAARHFRTGIQQVVEQRQPFHEKPVARLGKIAVEMPVA